MRLTCEWLCPVSVCVRDIDSHRRIFEILWWVAVDFVRMAVYFIKCAYICTPFIHPMNAAPFTYDSSVFHSTLFYFTIHWNVFSPIVQTRCSVQFYNPFDISSVCIRHTSGWMCWSTSKMEQNRTEQSFSTFHFSFVPFTHPSIYPFGFDTWCAFANAEHTHSLSISVKLYPAANNFIQAY